MRQEKPKKAGIDKSRFADLVKAAINEPGAWFAEDYPPEQIGGASGSILTTIGRTIAEVRTSGNTVYVRMNDGS